MDNEHYTSSRTPQYDVRCVLHLCSTLPRTWIPLDILIDHRFNQKCQSADANDKIVGLWFKKTYGTLYNEAQSLPKEDNVVNAVCPHRVANKKHCICSDCMYYFVDVNMFPLGKCAISFFVS